MNKTATALLIFIGLFCLSTISILYTGNFSITAPHTLLLLSIGLGLVLIHEFYTSQNSLRKVPALPTTNHFTKFISLLINICTLCFIGWIMIRADSSNFVIAIYMFITLLFIWVFFSKLLHKISISYIIIVAIALCLIWSFTVYPQPRSDFLACWNVSQKLFSGINPLGNKSPLAILYYGSIIHLFGNYLWAAFLINGFMGGLQVWLVYKITQLITSEQTSSKIAAILFALYPAAIIFSSAIQSELLMITSLLVAMYFLSKKLLLDASIQSNSYRLKNSFFIVITSLAIACAYLARNTAILFLFTGLVSISLFSSRKFKQKIVEILTIVLLFFIFLSPLIVFNYQQDGKFSIKSQRLSSIVLLNGISRETNGGYNAAQFKKVFADMGYTLSDLKNSEKIDEISENLTTFVINNIMNNKIDFIKFAMTKKFDRMWTNDNYSSWVTYQSKMFDIEPIFTKNQLDNFSTQYYLGLWLLALFSVLLLFLRNNILLNIISIYILLTFLLHFFCEVQPRYHLSVMPFVCMLAAYTFSEKFVVFKALQKRMFATKFLRENSI